MKTCIPIINAKDINKANLIKADLLELRTDLFSQLRTEHCSVITKIFRQCKKPVIITIKKNNQKFIQQAIKLKPAFIDIDYKIKFLISNFQFPKNRLIVSYHNYHKTPDLKFLDNLVKKGVNKIAVKINRIEDNLVIAKLLKKYPNKIIAIGMGDLGIMTRLDKRNMISYYALDNKKQSAPGQLMIKQKELKLYGIIGQNIQYTLSPKMHNWGFKQRKINAQYQIWDVQDLKIMMQIFREFNLAGASITVPHKEKIKKYLDVIDKDAQKIGAVNTVVSRNRRLFGYNTDWYGVTESIKKYINIKDKRVIILGRGGVAKAAKFGLAKYGAQVRMLSRKDLVDFSENFDILINATPVADKLLINKRLFKKNQIIFDFIYYKKTKLLQEAKKKGCVVINGLPMLKYQGEKQFNLWTKKKINYDKIIR